MELILEFKDIIGVIIGSAFTLISTYIIKNIGKLKIYVMEEKISYGIQNHYGDLEEQKTIKGATYFEYNVKLDIHNNSEFNKIMRNIKINIYNNENKFIESFTLKDKDTVRISCHSRIMDDLKMYNFPPKSICEINLGLYLYNDNMKNLINERNFKLEYTNERNKKKKINLNKHNFI